MPVIASGGMGGAQDFIDVVKKSGADAVSMADVLHYDRMSISQIRDNALAEKIHVRKI